MLNPFPELLAFQFVAITFLRIIIGTFYLYFGYLAVFKNPKRSEEFFRLAKFPFPKFWMHLTGWLTLLGGILFLLGAYVQYAAVILSIGTFGALLLKDREHPYLKKSAEFYILLFAVTFAMIFFGAGAVAFDIPL